jgi:hypothetical protein
MITTINVAVSSEGGQMRIYVFTSKSTKNLRAFTNDMSGNNLPRQFSPWHADGPIAPNEDSPHRFARDRIEKAIDESGFQLWRLKLKSKEKDKVKEKTD